MDALSMGTEMPEFNYQECITCMCRSEMGAEKAIKLKNPAAQTVDK